MLKLVYCFSCVKKSGGDWFIKLHSILKFKNGLRLSCKQRTRASYLISQRYELTQQYLPYGDRKTNVLRPSQIILPPGHCTCLQFTWVSCPTTDTKKFIDRYLHESVRSPRILFTCFLKLFLKKVYLFELQDAHM